MHTDKGCLRVLIRVILVWLHYLGLADLISALHFLHKCGIRVHAVALLEDDRIDLCQRLLDALRLNLKLWRIEIDHTFVAEAHLTHLREALLYGLALDPCQVLMRLANVLIRILGQKSEISCWNYLSED